MDTGSYLKGVYNMNIWLVLMDVVVIFGTIGTVAILAIPNAKLKAKFESVDSADSALSKAISIVSTMATLGWAVGVTYIYCKPQLLK